MSYAVRTLPFHPPLHSTSKSLQKYTFFFIHNRLVIFFFDRLVRIIYIADSQIVGLPQCDSPTNPLIVSSPHRLSSLNKPPRITRRHSVWPPSSTENNTHLRCSQHNEKAKPCPAKRNLRLARAGRNEPRIFIVSSLHRHSSPHC